MEMVKMKKFLIFAFVFLIVLILIYPIITPITPKTFFYLSESERKESVEKLSKNCLNGNILRLIVTYKEVLSDKKTAQCWHKFYEDCLNNKDDNQSLQIPIRCKTY